MLLNEYRMLVASASIINNRNSKSIYILFVNICLCCSTLFNLQLHVSIIKWILVSNKIGNELFNSYGNIIKYECDSIYNIVQEYENIFY